MPSYSERSSLLLETVKYIKSFIVFNLINNVAYPRDALCAFVTVMSANDKRSSLPHKSLNYTKISFIRCCTDLVEEVALNLNQKFSRKSLRLLQKDRARKKF